MRAIPFAIAVLLGGTAGGAELGSSGGPESRSGYWARKPIINPHCGKARSLVTAWIATPDVAKLEEKVRETLDSARAINISQACSNSYARPTDRRNDAPLVVINAWVDDSGIAELKSKLSGLSKAVDWKTGFSVGGVEASVAERWAALNRELSEKSSLLACSPNTVNLVKAEIARLEPYARAYLETKDKSHVQVLIYVPNN